MTPDIIVQVLLALGRFSGQVLDAMTLYSGPSDISREAAAPRSKPSAGKASTDGRIVAVLGPTNTGKTHLAVERMLGHSSGMIGLPLRLLAREIYDKVVAIKGRGNVALITGEEKIVPRNPAYYVCTVEAMPLSRSVAFLAVDEIQLATHWERGHIFTDRLLRARGREETMFMGAESMRPLIRILVPEAEIISRPRFSELRYAGAKKLSRLPKGSAIVAFSANEVYALAELVRRQRGGAAVVLGALSPRTRNAQVALYENGDVDYLVATDAIGMGLNLRINHVAFASTAKFDGQIHRPLDASELGQIAGRAGRYLNPGTFGLTGDLPTAGAALDPGLVEQIEHHRFAPAQKLQWRNAKLDFSSIPALFHSLEMPAPHASLVRAPDSIDALILKHLSRTPAITALISGPASVRTLWQTCQIPDFRKTLTENHAQLTGLIFHYLITRDGTLPADWMARNVAALDRTDGNIDTLSQRIAQMRVWSYIANQNAWLEDPTEWRERTRTIEDKLSDALHEHLTQRFVDYRTSMLMRRNRDQTETFATVDDNGDVHVEEFFIGQLEGLSFRVDPTARNKERRALLNAAARSLGAEIRTRVTSLTACSGDELAFKISNRQTPTAQIFWRGASIAEITRGSHILAPTVTLTTTEELPQALRRQGEKRLELWLQETIKTTMPHLATLAHAIEEGKFTPEDLKNPKDREFSGLSRGLIYQLTGSLGTVRYHEAREVARGIPDHERAILRAHGLVFGQKNIFLTEALKPYAVRLRVMLWAIWHRIETWPAIPDPGRVSLKLDDRGTENSSARAFYELCGYIACGRVLIRQDILERLATTLERKCQDQPIAANPQLLSATGCRRRDLPFVLKFLGYELSGKGESRVISRRGKTRTGHHRKTRSDGAKQQRRPHTRAAHGGSTALKIAMNTP